MELKVKAVLDEKFKPMALVYRDFVARAEKEGAEPVVIGIVRNQGFVSAF